jgi:hypothetical protein
MFPDTTACNKSTVVIPPDDWFKFWAFVGLDRGEKYYVRYLLLWMFTLKDAVRK